MTRLKVFSIEKGGGMGRELANGVHFISNIKWPTSD